MITNWNSCCRQLKKFNEDTDVKFGLEKCAKVTFLKNLEKSTSIELDNSMKTKESEQEEVYKYLGVNESNGIQHATMKQKMKKNATKSMGHP